MVLDATGKVGQTIELEDRIAKKKSGRRIPIHPELRKALVTLQRNRSNIFGPVAKSRKGGAMRPNSIVCWFKLLYQEIAFDGCSSHSGRRTFITLAARLTHKSWRLTARRAASCRASLHSDDGRNTSTVTLHAQRRPLRLLALSICKSAIDRETKAPSIKLTSRVDDTVELAATLQANQPEHRIEKGTARLNFSERGLDHATRSPFGRFAMPLANGHCLKM